MPEIEINDLAAIGAIRDTPSYMLPPEAWTNAVNMRAVDDGMERMSGWSSIFGTPGVAPHFAMPVSTTSATFWLYTSLTKAYGYDGTTHTDITRTVGGNYAATDSKDWNGTILGGVPIINNGVDVPQFWSTIALATPLVALTNWGGSVRCRVMRAFGPFLIALNVTDTGVAYPHMVRWSHPAVPGSVPSSWDVADPTKDTGEQDLPDINSGVLIDGLPLAGTFFLYKENSVWRMRFVGGRKIMDFGDTAWLPTTGLLAARCVCSAKRGTLHVLATQEDIIYHDGNSVNSMLNKRQKRRLFNEIDTTNFASSFMFENAAKNEVWFCYPGSGATYPNKAIVMNYQNEQWVLTEADGITFRNATVGPVESPSTSVWSDRSEAWDSAIDNWSDVDRRKVVCCGTGDTLFFGLDTTLTRNGSAFTAYLQREGLSVLGQKRNGAWIVDHEIMKLFKRVWPKAQGGPIQVRVGTQQLVNGTVTWGAYYSFDPSTGAVTRPLGVTADFSPVSGRALCVEFRSSDSVAWRLDGYKADIVPMGKF